MRFNDTRGEEEAVRLEHLPEDCSIILGSIFRTLIIGVSNYELERLD